MTFSNDWAVDITVSDLRGDAAETLLNQIKFTAIDIPGMISIEFYKPDGSKIAFSDSSTFINVR